MNKWILLLALFTAEVGAKIYQCGDGSFQQTPCLGDEEIELQLGYQPDPTNPVQLAEPNNPLSREYDYRLAIPKREIMVGMTPEHVRRS